ncbi:MAG: adenylate/guanylate cyclase domain-containing protein [Desulfobacteraceae bacterium]
MKCPKCQFDNREGAKFCGKCRTALSQVCPYCNSENPPENTFCDECGQELVKEAETEKTAPEPEGERKHVTVLFSDLSGYTAMSEKLDPEEVKEITSRIFSDISKVIDKYEGFVEKFVGDAVMALFGVPKAHEDDPIRAIKVAREIHELVDALSPEVEKRVGQPISMHTGINTGLVVTGEVDMEKGTHGVAGDPINLASRLSSLAGAGEILVGPVTYRRAEGHFTFEALEPTTLKGKAKLIQVHKVISPKGKPITLHRLSGIRADLIGRKMEVVQLAEAVENLREGKGRIFAIYGDAGTGKSRLIEEFKNSLDLEEIQWLEARAYAYSQNIPYFPLIDLLNGVFQIEEADPPGKIRKRIESGIEDLVGKKDDVIPFLGSLYALSYPEVDRVSPEFWKSRLQDAVLTILSALARRAPTVFCLEDLHWADNSFIELLRNAVIQVSYPAIVLCVYRPTFSLFRSHQLSGPTEIYREIKLQSLSSSEAQEMLESLLKTESIPTDLRRFVQDKAEGNPFYLEEVVNSLIESGTLIQDNGRWIIAKPISEADISSSIHGVIAGRLDRLENETKRVLQEASVIGRTFFYAILKKATELKIDIDQCLRGLEQIDLIRTRALQPDLEYMFKHALTQEVVYNGLLKKERKEIHDRIGLVMEELFRDRLPEFYETLAFHFKQGQSIHKAVYYLMKSGEKSVNRFALEEAHQYYQQAYELLYPKQDKTEEDKDLLFDLLEKWSLVYYYYGSFRDLVPLLQTHEALADSMKDISRRGMFHAWLGMALWGIGELKGSYHNLRKAITLGEEARDLRVIGYACTWLPLPCTELGLLDKGIEYGERAKIIAGQIPSDQYLYFKSRGDLGYLYYNRGEAGKALQAGRDMVKFGEEHSNIRSQAMGHAVVGWAHMAAGDYQAAISSFHQLEEIAVDPFYSTIWSYFKGVTHFLMGQYNEAEAAFEVAEKCREAGAGILTQLLPAAWGLLWIAKGRMGKGMSILLESILNFERLEWKCSYALSEYILGKVYLGMALGEGEVNLSTALKNLGFLLKTIPFAARRAQSHLTEAIDAAQEIGAKGTLASAHLDLGNLHKSKRRNEQARDHLTEAVKLFQQCEAEIFLNQAKEALASLN